MHKVLFGLFSVFDVATPEWVGAEVSFWLEISREHFDLVLSAITNIWDRAQSNVVNLHFVSEVGPEVFRDILRSARVVSFVWRRKKYYFFQLALRFVVTYLCPVRWRRRDCSRKVKDGWFEGLNFDLIWAGSKFYVLLQNSEQSACDD